MTNDQFPMLKDISFSPFQGEIKEGFAEDFCLKG